MDRASGISGGSARAAAERYFAVGGGTDRSGRPITKPPELEVAMAIDGMAQRYGCTPSAILDEPVSIMPIVELAAMAEQDAIKKQEAEMKKSARG